MNSETLARTGDAPMTSKPSTRTLTAHAWPGSSRQSRPLCWRSKFTVDDVKVIGGWDSLRYVVAATGGYPRPQTAWARTSKPPTQTTCLTTDLENSAGFFAGR